MKNYIFIILFVICGCESVKKDKSHVVIHSHMNTKQIPFKYNSLEILPEGYAAIDKWAIQLKKMGDWESKVFVSVFGNSCNNEILSDSLINLKRASKVIEYFRTNYNLNKIYIYLNKEGQDCTLSETLYPHVYISATYK